MGRKEIPLRKRHRGLCTRTYGQVYLTIGTTDCIDHLLLITNKDSIAMLLGRGPLATVIKRLTQGLGNPATAESETGRMNCQHRSSFESALNRWTLTNQSRSSDTKFNTYIHISIIEKEIFDKSRK